MTAEAAALDLSLPRAGAKRDPVGTRQRILDAATAEFVAHGFAGASVNRLAERAGVNKRMLYHCFGNKEALYLIVLEAIYARIRERE